MAKVDVTNYMHQFIKRKSISNQQIVDDTGIDIDALIQNHERLDADEFLRLCVYLNIKPEDMGDKSELL